MPGCLNVMVGCFFFTFFHFLLLGFTFFTTYTFVNYILLLKGAKCVIWIYFFIIFIFNTYQDLSVQKSVSMWAFFMDIFVRKILHVFFFCHSICTHFFSLFQMIVFSNKSSFCCIKHTHTHNLILHSTHYLCALLLFLHAICIGFRFFFIWIYWWFYSVFSEVLLQVVVQLIVNQVDQRNKHLRKQLFIK